MIRQFIGLAVFASLFAGRCAADPQMLGTAPSPAEPLSLWYRQPATNWVEALAIGNGEVAGDYDYVLRGIVEGTSGQFYDVRVGNEFVADLRDVIDGLRARYTLKYRPIGVPKTGWHDLRVSLVNGKYDVHARKGYFGQ